MTTVFQTEKDVPSGWFLHRFGSGPPVLIPVHDGLVLGRTNLKSKMISREHAELRMLDDDRILLLDKGSKKGTFVNGQRVSSKGRVLDDCDCICLADPIPKNSKYFGFFLRYKDHESDVFSTGGGDNLPRADVDKEDSQNKERDCTILKCPRLSRTDLDKVDETGLNNVEKGSSEKHAVIDTRVTRDGDEIDRVDISNAHESSTPKRSTLVNISGYRESTTLQNSHKNSLKDPSTIVASDKTWENKHDVIIISSENDEEDADSDKTVLFEPEGTPKRKLIQTNRANPTTKHDTRISCEPCSKTKITRPSDRKSHASDRSSAVLKQCKKVETNIIHSGERLSKTDQTSLKVAHNCSARKTSKISPSGSKDREHIHEDHLLKLGTKRKEPPRKVFKTQRSKPKEVSSPPRPRLEFNIQDYYWDSKPAIEPIYSTRISNAFPRPTTSVPFIRPKNDLVTSLKSGSSRTFSRNEGKARDLPSNRCYPLLRAELHLSWRFPDRPPSSASGHRKVGDPRRTSQ